MARGRGLPSRLGPRWRWVGAATLLRNGSALRLRRRPRGLLGPLGTAGLVPAARLIRPVAPIGLAGSVTMIGLLRPASLIALVGTTVAAAIVVPLVFGTGAPAGWLNVGRGNDAGAA